MEELSIQSDPNDVQQFRTCHLLKYDNVALGIKDYEFSETWQLTQYSGSLQVDSAEVVEALFVPIALLQDWASSDPSEFTPWFLNELQFITQRNEHPKSETRC